MSNKTQFKVKSVLNNNVIVAVNKKNEREMVIIAKGIGFKSKDKKLIKLREDEINKTYVTYQNDLQKEFSELLNQLDSKVMGLGEEIIAKAEKDLGPMNEHIHIALTDHIGFAIERFEKGMDINNPFLEETKVLYNDEYEIALDAIDMIEDRLEVKLPESEAGFIAIHLHSARQNKEVSDTVRNTSLIKDLIEMIEKELDINLDPGRLSSRRLINHLRFSLNRLRKGKKVENPFLENIKDNFAASYRLAKKVANKIEKRLDYEVNEQEVGFIALHLKRLKEYNIE